MSSESKRIFKCKQFSLTDHSSAMKIGTDAMLLGAYSSETDFKKALDIGCGCGILSLMLAQQGEGAVYAIDIDKNAVAEATENFQNSLWSTRLTAEHISLQEFAAQTDQKFNKIISNPPYFQNSLKSLTKGRNLARHNQSLTDKELAESVAKLICTNGHFDVIIPFDSAEELEKYMLIEGLNLHSQMLIRNRKDEPPIRVIQRYSANDQMGLVCNTLVLFNDNRSYSDQFKEFTRKFYLGF